MAGLFAKLAAMMTAPEPEAGRDQNALALAAVMVQLARADGVFGDDERARIEDMLEARFGDGSGLLAEAEAMAAAALDSQRFTSLLKRAYQPDERIGLIEDLWEVVLADGARDSHEDALMRKLGALLHVPDREIGLARQRVMAR